MKPKHVFFGSVWFLLLGWTYSAGFFTGLVYRAPQPPVAAVPVCAPQPPVVAPACPAPPPRVVCPPPPTCSSTAWRLAPGGEAECQPGSRLVLHDMGTGADPVAECDCAY